MIYLDPSHCCYEQATQTFYYEAPWSGQCHRYRSWDSGCRPEVEQNGEWNYAPNEIDLPLLVPDLAGHEEQHPASLYAAQIPQEIASIVKNYEVDQMTMLHLCASSERAVQLLHHSPNFLWFIGPFVVETSQGKPEIMHDLFGYSQKKLLEIAFGNATQCMVNMLKKLPTSVMSDERHYFLHTLADEACSGVLRHRQKCQWDLFKIVMRYRDMLQYPFARRMFSEELPSTELQRTLSIAGVIHRDTVRLGIMLRIENADRFVSGCKNWHALHSLHETWRHRLNSEQEAQKLARLAVPFPTPPIPGTPDILPLDTESKLLAEGSVMHHCVGCYSFAVRAGQSYIYQVLEPERATLELRLARNGEWRIAQIKSYCNAEVSNETKSFLQRWLIDTLRDNRAKK